MHTVELKSPLMGQRYRMQLPITQKQADAWRAARDAGDERKREELEAELFPLMNQEQKYFLRYGTSLKASAVKYDELSRNKSKLVEVTDKDWKTLTPAQIARKYGVTRQRVYQFSDYFGIKRRSPMNEKRALLESITDEEWVAMSNRAIAQQKLGNKITSSTVGRYRKMEGKPSFDSGDFLSVVSDEDWANLKLKEISEKYGLPWQPAVYSRYRRSRGLE